MGLQSDNGFHRNHCEFTWIHCRNLSPGKRPRWFVFGNSDLFCLAIMLFHYCLLGTISPCLGMLSHLTRLNFPSRNLGENHLHLPLPVMRLLSSLKCEAKKNWGHGFKIDLIVAGPAGFTLPCNIGDLSPAITTLELSSCHLTGCFRFFSHTFCLSLSFSYRHVFVIIKARSLRV